MGLNNITLSPGMLASIYGNVLVEPAKNEVASPDRQMEQPDKGLKFLGNNQKKTVVVVNYPSISFLPDGQLGFLTKILSACKLSIADIALLNIGNKPAIISDIQKTLRPEYMLLFGVSAEKIGLPLTFPEFQLQEYAGCRYLLAPSLEHLNQESKESHEYKKQLWPKLQDLFSV